MSSDKKNKVLLGSGVLLALASSLCCIIPILAIVGGTGSAISALNWVAPLRPYLLVATAFALGFAFYRAYKPKIKDECGCEEKKGFIHSKVFLWIIACVSVLLSTFPYYEKFFHNQIPQKQAVMNNSDHVSYAVLYIQGMSCEACEGHVNNALNKKAGVKQVNTSYVKGMSIVKFDSTQISLQQLTTGVENETGYKIIKIEKQ